MSTATIRITYEIVTPESAEDGEAAEQGWEDEDGSEYTFREAVKLLEGKEPSSSWFHRGIWYTDHDSDIDYATGAETRQSYHVTASDSFQRRLYAVVTKR